MPDSTLADFTEQAEAQLKITKKPCAGSDNQTALTEEMTSKAIEAAQDLTREIGKPKNVVRALDQYLK